MEPLKNNASLFMPLMGAVETKSEIEAESDEIDWSLGEENAPAPADPAPAADSTQNVDDSSSTDSSSEDLDSLFDDSEDDADAQEEEEEDPFA